MASHTPAELREASRVLAAVMPEQPPAAEPPRPTEGPARVFDGLAEAA